MFNSLKKVDSRFIANLEEKLITVYQQSRIFKNKESRKIFKSQNTFGSNFTIVQIPDTEDYIYRALYYFIMFYSFESGEVNSHILI